MIPSKEYLLKETLMMSKSYRLSKPLVNGLLGDMKWLNKYFRSGMMDFNLEPF